MGGATVTVKFKVKRGGSLLLGCEGRSKLIVPPEAMTVPVTI